MQPRTLTLTDDCRRELEHTRDHDSRPYLRECTAALLKIAAGQSPRQVALTGLYQPHHPRTVRRWLTKYEAGGLAALVQPARHRRGLSPPRPGAGGPDGAPGTDAARACAQPLAPG